MTGMAMLLMAEAQDIASTLLQRRDDALQAKLLELEKEKATIVTERKSIGLAQNRALTFKPRIGPDYQCPACWVKDEKQSRIDFVADASGDHARCDVCGFDARYPLRG
jgi:hypothetical protein